MLEVPVGAESAPRLELAEWREQFGIVAGITGAGNGTAPFDLGLAGRTTSVATVLEHWRALQAHARLVTRVEELARDGDPDPALGGGLLAQLMSDGEATAVDLGRLADRAQRELDRLTALLGEACARLWERESLLHVGGPVGVLPV